VTDVNRVVIGDAYEALLPAYSGCGCLIRVIKYASDILNVYSDRRACSNYRITCIVEMIVLFIETGHNRSQYYFEIIGFINEVGYWNKTSKWLSMEKRLQRERECVRACVRVWVWVWVWGGGVHRSCRRN
jgi:hypothetical protein